MEQLCENKLIFLKNFIEKKIKIPTNLFIFSDQKFSPASKVAKIVCAVANRGGGDLFFGLNEKNGRITEFLPIENPNFDEEWLYYEIQSYIEQPIKDLQVNFIPLENNKIIINIFIPINNIQPHLFADGKFYKFENKQILQMKESEIRQQYGKINHNELEIIGITNTNGLPILKDGKFESINFYPKIFIKNSGNMCEKFYKTEISFPSSLFEENYQPLTNIFVRYDGKYSVFSSAGTSILFQNEINTAIEAKIQVDSHNIDDFLTENLNIALFFSNGVKKQSLKLSNILTYNGKELAKTDF